MSILRDNDDLDHWCCWASERCGFGCSRQAQILRCAELHPPFNPCFFQLELFAVFYIIWVFRELSTLPYNQFRMGNLIIRLQTRIRTFSFIFYILAFLISFVAGSESCSTFVLLRFGLTPAQIVVTASIVCWGWLSMPIRPDEKAILQVWLQGRWENNDYDNDGVLPWRCRIGEDEGSGGDVLCIACVRYHSSTQTKRLNTSRFLTSISVCSLSRCVFYLFGVVHHHLPPLL